MNYKLLGTFIVCFILIIFRRPDMLFNPQPWAEDGTIFISDAIYMGFHSYFIPYAGYYHFIPRLITYLSVLVSEWMGQGITLVPLFMNLSGIMIAAFCVSYFVFKRFDKITPFHLRFISCIFIVSMPGIYELCGTITNVQWWIGIFWFFVCLDMVYNQRFPKAWELIFLIPFSLTGVLGVFVIPVCAYLLYIKWKHTKDIKKLVYDLIVSIALCAGTVVQIFVALQERVSDIQQDSIMIVTLVPRFVLGGIFGRLVIPDFKEFVNMYMFSTLVLIGVLVLAIIVWSHKDKKHLWFPATFILFHCMMTLKGAPFVFTLYREPFPDFGNRYIFIPASIVLIYLFSSLQYFEVKKSRLIYKNVALIAVVAMVTITSMNNYSLAPYKDKNYKVSVSNYNSKGNNKCSTEINPDGFGFVFPCK